MTPSLRSEPGSMSSIKRDVKKKTRPRPEAEKIFVLDTQHTLYRRAARLDGGDLLWLVCHSLLVSFSDSDHAHRVLKLGKRAWSWTASVLIAIKPSSVLQHLFNLPKQGQSQSRCFGTREGVAAVFQRSTLRVERKIPGDSLRICRSPVNESNGDMSPATA